MMRKRPSIAVPRLKLTPGEENDLRQLSDALELEVVAQYEQFLFRHRRRVDTTRWKATRHQEDLHVYTERDDFWKTWRHESKMPDEPGPLATLTQYSSVPMVFVTGTVQGSLDDALFGNTFLDTPSLRIRDAYLKRKADDATLLTVIDAPHVDDPFRFLGVTYASRKSAVAIGRPRELLLLTGVRATQLSTGERIGVAFHRSITHATLPRDVNGQSNVRGDACMVAIYRQLDERRVEVFIVDFCDLQGGSSLSSFAAVKQSIAMLVPQAHSGHAGVQKKLYWLMRERAKATGTGPETDSFNGSSSIHSFSRSSSSPMPEPRVEVAFCDICDSSFSALGRSSSLCQLCGEQVCGKCLVSKQIAIDASTVEVETKHFAFCVGCMHHAKNYSAADIALQDLDELWMQTVGRGRGRRLKTQSSDDTRATTLMEWY